MVKYGEIDRGICPTTRNHRLDAAVLVGRRAGRERGATPSVGPMIPTASDPGGAGVPKRRTSELGKT